MNKIVEIGVISIGVIAIVIADILLKKISLDANGMRAAIAHRLMFLVVALYLVQVVAYTYVFVNHVQLSTVSIIQTALYVIALSASGLYFFGETIGVREGVGILFALMGVVLLS